MLNRICTVAALGLLGVSAQAHAQVIADSVNEFSNIQGKNNWGYGYYDRTGDANKIYEVSDFVSLPRYDWGRSQWFIDVSANPQPAYFTSTDSVHQRVNSTTTALNRTPREHWNVRRYVSEVTGLIQLDGYSREDITFDTSAKAMDDGVTVRIYHNGREVYFRDIAKTEITPVAYSLMLDVKQGDSIDFVATPKANDLYDCPAFTSTITLIPEPASCAFALLAVGGMLARRQSRK